MLLTRNTWTQAPFNWRPNVSSRWSHFRWARSLIADKRETEDTNRSDELDIEHGGFISIRKFRLSYILQFTECSIYSDDTIFHCLSCIWQTTISNHSLNEYTTSKNQGKWSESEKKSVGCCAMIEMKMNSDKSIEFNYCQLISWINWNEDTQRANHIHSR